MSRPDHVSLQLTRDQALVLFEFLSNWEETERLSIGFASEERVLDVLLGQLQKLLAEPFSARYKQIIDEARKRVDDAWSSEPTI
jgi:hypothetical protein